MNTPAFDGFDTTEATFLKDKNVAVGKAVGVGTLKRASILADDGLFCGICSAVNDLYASVILKGHARVKYSGTAPTLGYNKLASDGNGYVKVSENGRHILVLDIDTVNQLIDIIL